MKTYRALIMIIGFFIVMGTVDAVFITLAASSYPGTVTTNPYQKGMGYNKVLQQSGQQAKLGWEIKSKIKNTKKQEVSYEISLKNKTAPVNDALVSLLIVRPLGDAPDFTVRMENIGSGVYQAIISLPQIGQWELRTNIMHGHDALYHRERIVIAETAIK